MSSSSSKLTLWRWVKAGRFSVRMFSTSYSLVLWRIHVRNAYPSWCLVFLHEVVLHLPVFIEKTKAAWMEALERGLVGGTLCIRRGELVVAISEGVL